MKEIKDDRASLMAQWLGVCLPMQGTRVRALVWEDPTCHRAAKPVLYNYWAWALELASHNYWAHVPLLLKPAHQEPVLRNGGGGGTAVSGPCTMAKGSPCSPQLERACAQQQRPNAATKKKKKSLELSIGSSNPPPRHIPRQNYKSKRYMNPYVLSSTTYNSQGMETA